MHTFLTADKSKPVTKKKKVSFSQSTKNKRATPLSLRGDVLSSKPSKPSQSQPLISANQLASAKGIK